MREQPTTRAGCHLLANSSIQVACSGLSLPGFLIDSPGSLPNLEIRLLLDSIALLVTERERLPVLRLSPAQVRGLGGGAKVQVLSASSIEEQVHSLDVQLQASEARQTDEGLQELHALLLETLHLLISYQEPRPTSSLNTSSELKYFLQVQDLSISRDPSASSSGLMLKIKYSLPP